VFKRKTKGMVLRMKNKERYKGEDKARDYGWSDKD